MSSSGNDQLDQVIAFIQGQACVMMVLVGGTLDLLAQNYHAPARLSRAMNAGIHAAS
ncbi:MAG: hypothetical protein JSV61_14285 [Anaerolineales bacterium]|nr:MAG: hypothetical protein JSV61_14285 [Anaerolineales bacterium]